MANTARVASVVVGEFREPDETGLVIRRLLFLLLTARAHSFKCFPAFCFLFAPTYSYLPSTTDCVTEKWILDSVQFHVVSISICIELDLLICIF